MSNSVVDWQHALIGWWPISNVLLTDNKDPWIADVCHATSLFTTSAKVWNSDFNWFVCTAFWCPNSKEIS